MECIVYKTIKRVGLSNARVKEVVLSVLRKQRKSKKAQVSIHFIGDTRMRRMNLLYRGRDTSTDVLSFGLENDARGKTREATDFGDIFVCVPYVKRQSKRFNVSYKEEAYRMIIHGVLHLLGYDHQKQKDAAKMFALQEKYLASVL